eukprot:Gb_24872 [translate_table: standard]
MMSTPSQHSLWHTAEKNDLQGRLQTVAHIIHILSEINIGAQRLAMVTCFAEAGGQHVRGMARAVQCLGIRGCLAQSTMDAGHGLPTSWSNNTANSCIQIQNCSISFRMHLED